MPCWSSYWLLVGWWWMESSLSFLRARGLPCHLPPETAVLRGARRHRALARPVPESRDLGFSDSRVRVLGARQSRAAGFSRDSGPREPGGGAAAPEIPRRDSRNPRIREPGTGRRGRPEETGELVVCVSKGSAPRSVSSPGLLGKPCLKTRKETRSNGAHPCFVPFKLECSKDSGERRLAVCCFSAASVRACALRAATSENIPDSGFRRKRIPKWNHSCTCRRPRRSYARSSRRPCSGRRSSV